MMKKKLALLLCMAFMAAVLGSAFAGAVEADDAIVMENIYNELYAPVQEGSTLEYLGERAFIYFPDYPLQGFYVLSEPTGAGEVDEDEFLSDPSYFEYWWNSVGGVDFTTPFAGEMAFTSDYTEKGTVDFGGRQARWVTAKAQVGIDSFIVDVAVTVRDGQYYSVMLVRSGLLKFDLTPLFKNFAQTVSFDGDAGAASVGIIGGSDGPTAIYVTEGMKEGSAYGMNFAVPQTFSQADEYGTVYYAVDTDMPQEGALLFVDPSFFGMMEQMIDTDVLLSGEATQEDWEEFVLMMGMDGDDMTVSPAQVAGVNVSVLSMEIEDTYGDGRKYHANMTILPYGGEIYVLASVSNDENTEMMEEAFANVLDTLSFDGASVPQEEEPVPEGHERVFNMTFVMPEGMSVYESYGTAYFSFDDGGYYDSQIMLTKPMSMEMVADLITQSLSSLYSYNYFQNYGDYDNEDYDYNGYDYEEAPVEEPLEEEPVPGLPGDEPAAATEEPAYDEAEFAVDDYDVPLYGSEDYMDNEAYADMLSGLYSGDFDVEAFGELLGEILKKVNYAEILSSMKDLGMDFSMKAEPVAGVDAMRIAITATMDGEEEAFVIDYVLLAKDEYFQILMAAGTDSNEIKLEEALEEILATATFAEDWGNSAMKASDLLYAGAYAEEVALDEITESYQDEMSGAVAEAYFGQGDQPASAAQSGTREFADMIFTPPEGAECSAYDDEIYYYFEGEPDEDGVGYIAASISVVLPVSEEEINFSLEEEVSFADLSSEEDWKPLMDQLIYFYDDLEYGTLTVDGVDAYTASTRYEYSEGSVDVEEYVLFLHNDKLHGIMFSCTEASEQEMRPVFEEFIASMELV